MTVTLGRVKSIVVKWHRWNEYTRWRGWIDHGVTFTTYHFGPFVLTVARDTLASDSRGSARPADVSDSGEKSAGS